MCEFCVKHGEGKKWYLNAKNYSNDLLSDLERRKLAEDAGYWIDDLYNKKYKLIKLLPFKSPTVRKFIGGFVQKWMQYKHWGQVVPIEDIGQILDLVNSITRIPCVCRRITKGKEVRSCFLISLDPSKIGMADIVDQSYLGGPDVAKFEKVDRQWVLNFMKESESKGMLHTIWTIKTPFIGSICNCDFSTGCIAMTMYKEFVPIVFQAEYIITIDRDLCVGCRKCIKICQFDAIAFDEKNKKAIINENKCFGCGVCRAICEKNALSLRDRKCDIGLAKLW